MNKSGYLKDLLPVVTDAAIGAGSAALALYEGAFEVTEKADRSPLTLADQRSHEVIASALGETGIPVLSEEGRDIPYEERRSWPRLWIVDPLDGTKEFVKRNGEFTVNIALVKDCRPVMGVIYVPVTGVLYFAAEDAGARVILPAEMPAGESPGIDALLSASRQLPLEKDPQRPYTVMGSRSHPSPKLSEWLGKLRRQHPNAAFVAAGSSLKFCRIAEGYADIYPRMGPTMEWDTAAGQAVVEQAGGMVYDFHTRMPLQYNKANLKNPWFIVEGPQYFAT